MAVSALALTLVLAGTATLLRARAASSLSPSAGADDLQIVYRAFTGEEAVGSVYAMNLDGKDVQPLTFDGQPFYQFSCSGDGGHLAFIIEGQLYVMAVDDAAPHPVGERQQGLLGISLSGDGSRAALLTVQNQSRFVVSLLDLRDNSLTKLMETTMQLQFVGVAAVTLSPDASHVLFEKPKLRYLPNNTYSAEGAEIFEFEVANPREQRSLGEGVAPGWSPDSRVIAYGANGNLLLRDWPTGKVWTLALARESVYGSGGIWGPAWSPDGQRIAAWSYLDLATIFVTDLRGNTSPTRTTNGQRQIEPCFLTARPKALLAPAS